MREPITIWMLLPAVSLCETPWHWPHLPIYLRERSTYPLVVPFLSTTVCSTMMLRRERVVVEICQHLLLPLNFFPRSFRLGCRPASLVRKIDRTGREKKKWSNWSNWWREQFTLEKVDTSNRLSLWGVPTPGALPFVSSRSDIFVVSLALCPNGGRWRKSGRLCFRYIQSESIWNTPHKKCVRNPG